MLPEAGPVPVAGRVLRLAAAWLAGLALSGCYLSHVSGGHMALMEARRPIEQVMAGADTPAACYAATLPYAPVSGATVPPPSPAAAGCWL